MSTTRELDVNQLCPHCCAMKYCVLYEDFCGFEMLTGQCKACDFRVDVTPGHGPWEEARIRTNIRDGVTIYGDHSVEDVYHEFGCASLVASRLLADQRAGSQRERFWCVFVRLDGVVNVHGCAPDTPAYHEAVTFAKNALTRIVVVATEDLAEIPEPLVID
ncbi:hypothetical protein [Burkholderia sp. MBR-1]|uniref:hypothetical protein n=1 Tax=Burkholderia sp. MBR-1 TaxID=2732364 RepID=UPI0015EEA0E3|nr:hypothetical protein [Burkholderia sp. MBR-1]QMI49908.1 hypothetical protein MBR110_31100 [Burkholderia sp. MBR-1]